MVIGSETLIVYEDGPGKSVTSYVFVLLSH
jgi:hypothetical protein